MRPASSVTDFLSDPTGRYYCGRKHAVFSHSSSLLGVVAWGHPDVDDLHELLHLCEIGLRPDAPPYSFVADYRAVQVIEPRTYAQFVDFTRRHRETLRRKIVKRVQLRPGGWVGAVVSGLALVEPPPYPDRAFDDPDEAWAWLGIARPHGAELLAELDGIRASAEGLDPTVRRARELFATTSVRTLDELASRLHMTSRSCQRALAESGTSFRAELRAARMNRARDLLAAGERNITWIAAELGFSSVQHFATAFRHATGETPTAWRARPRA